MVEKTTEGEKSNPDMKESREKFEKKYTKGVCEALLRAGAITDLPSCVEKSKTTAENISKTWEEHWTKKMKKFLGVE